MLEKRHFKKADKTKERLPTTTERMLFYAGKTSFLGEVHRGNTVTDYLTQERERGITICSSAVTFLWNGQKINLLDTPGHIDFTMEVEQSLHAVDGVIIVLDGTAGVEAQTQTVWFQAEKRNLPKIVFIKMDRPDADFEKYIVDLRNKLEAKPVCLQYRCKDSKGNLCLERFTWQSETSGRVFNAVSITERSLLRALDEKRNSLIDQHNNNLYIHNFYKHETLSFIFMCMHSSALFLITFFEIPKKIPQTSLGWYGHH
ncbi:ribosome-releasing factor 2, mitochondrial-like [Glossina fuscipes fuscipes]